MQIFTGRGLATLQAPLAACTSIVTTTHAQNLDSADLGSSKKHEPTLEGMHGLREKAGACENVAFQETTIVGQPCLRNTIYHTYCQDRTVFLF